MIEQERGIEQEEKHRSDEITKQKENKETKKAKILNEETKNEKHEIEDDRRRSGSVRGRENKSEKEGKTGSLKKGKCRR